MIPSRRLCDCHTGDLFRIEREAWMRLVFPSRGLYQCANCRQVMLLPASDVVQAREQRRQHASAAQPVSVA
jgi:hypothetical protein